MAFSFPSLRVATFTPDLQRSLEDAIDSLLPGQLTVAIQYLDIEDEGGLFFDLAVYFLDGPAVLQNALTLATVIGGQVAFCLLGQRKRSCVASPGKKREEARHSF